MTNELEPCPNPECGEVPVVYSSYDNPDSESSVRTGWGYTQVQCRHCEVNGPVVEFIQGITEEESKQQARDKWNALPRRPVFSAELPTEAGYYWIKAPNDEPYFDYLRRVPKITALLLPHGSGFVPVNLLESGYQFAGPLPEPTEAK